MSVNDTEKRKFLSRKTDMHSKQGSSSTYGLILFFPMKYRNFPNFLAKSWRDGVVFIKVKRLKAATSD